MKVAWVLIALIALALPAGLQAQRSPPPIVQVPAAIADWKQGTIAKMAVAYTVNASGSVLGFACAKSCNFYVNISIRCERDGKYVAMINSPNGVITVYPTCAQVPLDDGDTVYLMVFGSKDMVDAIDGTGEIGFAVALESGRFNVARFSMRGAVAACAQAVKRAQSSDPQTEGLRDYTL